MVSIRKYALAKVIELNTEVRCGGLAERQASVAGNFPANPVHFFAPTQLYISGVTRD
jgi:hypothetical protein